MIVARLAEARPAHRREGPDSRAAAAGRDRLRDQLQTSFGAAFTLERELGGGGMSRVFVAREEALGRAVVVKVLAPELAEGLSAERFTREILLAARLQHPNVVPVLAAGTGSDGLPYYTMPFIAGASLRARLAARPVPLAETLAVLRDVARALAYAHAQGVVHRDIKPENLLLTGGAAVVADFGIAKALSAATGGGATLTQLGMAVGTPAYMAPEQAVGDAALDHRADLYALGVIAYELTAGVHPFAGRSAQALVVAHLTELPAPLAERRPDVPAALSALILRLLAKSPDDRPVSADAVVQLLDGLSTASGDGAGTSSSGTRPRPRGATPKDAMSVRRALVAVVAVAIAVVSAVRGVSTPERLASRPRRAGVALRRDGQRCARAPEPRARARAAPRRRALG